MKKITTLLVTGITFICCSGFGLGGFSNDLKSSHYESVAGIKARVPYANYTEYFGYVDTNVQPEGKYKDKDAYYLYVWVPAAMDEIGLSMISPAKGKPEKDDFKTKGFKKWKKKNKKKYFDTYLVLDRLDVVDAAKIKDAGNKAYELSKNDDSSELPKNPGGSHYNSLLRHVSEPSKPTKALVRGLYRITFTSFRGDVNGTYLATIGTNVPGIKIAASLDELHKLVNE